jgi:hypothetical protein
MATRKAPAKKTAVTKSPASIDRSEEVDVYMSKLEHPLKAEIEAVRTILKNANKKMAERIKWKSPSYFYIKDFAAFNLRAKGFVHLIVLFPLGMGDHASNPLLEGDHKDRREVKLFDMSDIKAKKKALEKLVNDWVREMDEPA